MKTCLRCGCEIPGINMGFCEPCQDAIDVILARRTAELIEDAKRRGVYRGIF